MASRVRLSALIKSPQTSAVRHVNSSVVSSHTACFPAIHGVGLLGHSHSLNGDASLPDEPEALHPASFSIGEGA